MLPTTKTSIWLLMTISLFVSSISTRSINQSRIIDDAELQIRRKLSIYATSIDTKNFDALDEIFTEHVVVRYPYPPPDDLITGRATFQAVLKTRLGNLVTQHAISTTVVNFANRHEANSTAYLVATYLGQGKLAGQTLSYYGKYLDTWVLEGGEWKSNNRELAAFVSVDPFDRFVTKKLV